MLDKKTLITVGVIGAGVLAGIFVWRGFIREHAPANLIGNASGL